MKHLFITLHLLFAITLIATAQKAQPKVTIRVLDKETLRPIQATIVVMSQRADKQLEPVYEDRMYKFKVSAGDTSILTIYAQGYQTVNEPIWASRLTGVETFYLTPIASATKPEQPKPILKEEISTVLYFHQSESTVLERSKPHLEHIIEFLQNNANAHIELAGHTDNVGDSFKNYLLSDQRADTIKDYLLGSIFHPIASEAALTGTKNQPHQTTPKPTEV